MTTEIKHCQARRYNDEYSCSSCNLVWGVGEDAPPCNPLTKIKPPVVERQRTIAAPARNQGKTKNINGDDFAKLREAMETGDFSKLI